MESHWQFKYPRMITWESTQSAHMLPSDRPHLCSQPPTGALWLIVCDWHSPRKEEAKGPLEIVRDLLPQSLSVETEARASTDPVSDARGRAPEETGVTQEETLLKEKVPAPGHPHRKRLSPVGHSRPCAHMECLGEVTRVSRQRIKPGSGTRPTLGAPSRCIS